jgi:PAS domain S-box-containing protein
MKHLVFSLQGRQRFFFTLLVTMLLLAGEFAYYFHRKNVIQASQYEEIYAIANLKANQLSQWIIERKGDAQVVSKSPFFSGEVVRWLNHKDNTTLKVQLQNRLQLVKNSYNYNGIFIINTRGEMLLSSLNDSLLLLSDYKNRVSMLPTINDSVFYDFYLCNAHKSIHFDFLTPICNSKHEVMAYLVLRMDPHHYIYPLIETWPTRSYSGETEIFKQVGDSVLFLNNLRHRQNTALTFSVPLSDVHGPAAQAVMGKTGLFDGLDYRGKKVMAYLQQIPNTNWYMVAKKDRNEIYTELHHSMLVITGFVIILIVLMLLVFNLTYSKQQQKNMEELLLKEIELRRNREEHKAILYSIGDGVISTDNKGKITRMNPVAEQLTGWTESESIGLPIYTVFNIIHEDSREPAENPIDAVIEGRKIVGVANHTLLISKSGDEIPIADSGAPIFNANNEVVGVVLVFRDQTEEHAANKAILENEIKFRNLFERSPIGKSMTGIDGSLNVNQAFCDMLGYTKAEMQTMKWMEISPAEDAEKSHNVVQLLLKGEIENAHFEKRYFHKNGQTLWTDVSTYLQRDKVGNPQFFITAITDISEYKEAIEALEKSEYRLRSTLDNMLEGVQILNKDLVYIYLNRAAEKQNRTHKEDFLGKKYGDVWPNIELTKVFLLISDCRDNGTSHHFENELVFPDGKSGWFELSIQPVPEGVFILSMDITKRKNAEKDLIKLNNELELRVATRTQELNDLYHNAPCGYHSLNKKGQIELINNTELKWLGFDRSELEGKVFMECLLSNESKKVYASNFPAFIENGTLSNLELDLVRKNGTILSVLLNATAIYDKNRQFIRSRSTITDHTEKKKAEKALIKALKKLEETNKDLESFSYSVSHDLRAPLRHINGYVELLKDHAQNSLSEKDLHYLQIINDAALQLGKLIDELLQFSRTGRKDMTIESIDLNNLLSEVFELLLNDTLTRRIEWRVAMLPSVFGDYNLLLLVWTNLVSNAIKFSQKKEIAVIELGYVESDSEYQFFVKDNGAGFDMQYAQKLFGVFQRMHTASEFEGTGIGLANVKRIIVKHGGTVWVEAEPNKGATFYFTLPKHMEDKND